MRLIKSYTIPEFKYVYMGENELKCYTNKRKADGKDFFFFRGESVIGLIIIVFLPQEIDTGEKVKEFLASKDRVISKFENDSGKEIFIMHKKQEKKSSML